MSPSFSLILSISSIVLLRSKNNSSLNSSISSSFASKVTTSWNEAILETEISFEDSLSYDAEGNELHLEDVLGTEDDVVTKELENKIEKKLLIEEIEKLNERDKKIMILRYGLFGNEEITQKDVADMLGISQSYISRIEKKVIKRLKNIVKI